MSDEILPDPDRFQTTNWSIVRHAGDAFDESQSAALQELLGRYWPALRAYLIRCRGVHQVDADDLVQSFIEHKILERNLIGTAEQGRGRFRSLLLRSLDNYVKNEWARMAAKKRAADRAIAIQDNSDFASAGEEDAAQRFDLQWAKAVLDQAAERMQSECRQSERDELWTLFHGRVLAPIYEGIEPIGYEEIVSRYRFRSPAQASNALMTGKRMFARSLRIVISQYVQSDSEVEDELRELQRIVARG